MNEDLVTQEVELPSGQLRVLQPAESAELPDQHEIEWAPMAPYWTVLWRSGVALAELVDGADLGGKRVVELGCGLGVPSLAAARGGADVLATDDSEEAMSLLARTARSNEIELQTMQLDWTRPEALLERAPFDLVLASDLLYERANVGAMLALLPRLATEVWLADPGRTEAQAFLDQAQSRWSIESTRDGLVSLHLLRLREGGHTSPERTQERDGGSG